MKHKVKRFRMWLARKLVGKQKAIFNFDIQEGGMSIKGLSHCYLYVNVYGTAPAPVVERCDYCTISVIGCGVRK